MTTIDQPIAPDWGKEFGIRELWSEILPGLWMGGTSDRDTIFDPPAHRRVRGFPVPFDEPEITEDSFDAVVTLYQYAQPVGWGVQEYRYCIMDSHDGITNADTLRQVAAWAYDQWMSGQRVLVRCQAGLNRSGLVMALVLMKDGATADEAIALIREKRSTEALFNKGFVKFLQDEVTA